MINEATLAILLVVFMMLNFVTVGYLFFVLIDKMRMSKVKSTLYITLQVISTFLVALLFYHFVISRFTDPAYLNFPNLRDYSLYYMIGWNAFFAFLALLYLLNAIAHHIYAKRRLESY
ncbi:hypothetical protein FLK61_36400 [Paenalkalicoccus suaedae]|uniref:Uncharacterized protein n=1 Tax=Paenalkalicoccus suaedae TaxID=2592382 RepID=A0A859FHL4_9BACI|nr:hypothetical protein [Paenalkalicoccus suaedae]QKS72142.1 hypothetical protein FLK61_36400 [Paenalkalicoccus suaedae]